MNLTIKPFPVEHHGDPGTARLPQWGVQYPDGRVLWAKAGDEAGAIDGSSPGLPNQKRQYHVGDRGIPAQSFTVLQQDYRAMLASVGVKGVRLTRRFRWVQVEVTADTATPDSISSVTVDRLQGTTDPQPRGTIQGRIRLDDGTASDFQITLPSGAGDGAGWQQWGANTPRLGQTSTLLAALAAQVQPWWDAEFAAEQADLADDEADE